MCSTQTRDPLYIRKGGKDISNRTEGPRQVYVVAIQPAENLTGGTLEAFGDGLEVAGVFTAFPIRQSALITSDDVHTAVCAVVIQNDVFEIRVTLIHHALNCGADEVRIIMVRRDQADRG